MGAWEEILKLCWGKWELWRDKAQRRIRSLWWVEMWYWKERVAWNEGRLLRSVFLKLLVYFLTLASTKWVWKKGEGCGLNSFPCLPEWAWQFVCLGLGQTHLTQEFSCLYSQQGLGVSWGQFHVITSVIFCRNLMFLLNWMSLYTLRPRAAGHLNNALCSCFFWHPVPW